MQKISRTSTILMSAIGAMAPMLSFAQPPAAIPTYNYEKCFGVNAAGKNDCAATGSHSCAGASKRAHDPKSFIYVPSGTCSKIEGGSTSAK
jgi:uncharacterized membrane protein